MNLRHRVAVTKETAKTKLKDLTVVGRAGSFVVKTILEQVDQGVESPVIYQKKQKVHGYIGSFLPRVVDNANQRFIEMQRPELQIDLNTSSTASKEPTRVGYGNPEAHLYSERFIAYAAKVMTRPVTAMPRLAAVPDLTPVLSEEPTYAIAA